MRMPARSTVPVAIVDQSGTSVDSATHTTLAFDVCGSWSDNDYISCDEQESRVRESIADAMNEHSARSAAQPQLRMSHSNNSE